MPLLEKALKDRGDRLFWIGRRSPGLDSTTIRGVPPGNPFAAKKIFEREGHLPLLDDPVAFENAYLSSYTYQMSRYSRGYGSRGHDLNRFHEYRDQFHLTARKFKRLLIREGITSVSFFNMPHTGDDFLLYRVAESMGLPVIMLMVSPFENRFFSTRSIEGFGRLNRENGVKLDLNVRMDDFDKQVKATVQSYMWGTRRSEKRSVSEVAFAVRLLLRRSLGSFLNPKGLKTEIAEIVRLQRGLKSRRRTLREIGRGKTTRTFLSWVGGLEKNPETLPERFIYVPLHLQPELTSVPQGGIFGDQALALEVLSSRLPDGMDIVAKENPKQGTYHREETYTDRLRQLDRVSVMHPSLSSQLLEDKCAAVATVTGTAGWEAIRDSRPCICFGHAWYLDCPGVHKFDENFDVEFVISNPPQRDKSEKFLQEVIAKSHEGITYEFFLKDDDPMYIKKNLQSITNTLEGLIFAEIESTFC